MKNLVVTILIFINIYIYIGIALYNSKVYNNANIKREKYLQSLQLLTEFQGLINTNKENICNIISTQINQLINADKCILYLINNINTINNMNDMESGNRNMYEITMNEYKEHSLDRGMVASVVHNGSILNIVDVYEHMQFSSAMVSCIVNVFDMCNVC